MSGLGTRFLRNYHGGAVDGVILHRRQRIVGAIEGECGDARAETDFGRDFEKIAGIGATGNSIVWRSTRHVPTSNSAIPMPDSARCSP